MIISIARKAAILATGVAIAALALFGGAADRYQPVAEAQVIEPFCGIGDVYACVTIVKASREEGPSPLFDFHVTEPFDDFSLEIGEDEQLTFFSSSFTTITITEEPAPGWELVSILCSVDDAHPDLEIDIEEGRVSIQFDSQIDRDITCTFFNSPVEEEDEDEQDSGRFIGGGLFAGDMSAAERNRARANAAGAAAAASAPAPAATSVRPPSTGDGGLR